MRESNLKVIDAHAHLTSSEYKMDAHAAIKRAKDGNVEVIINICTSISELEEGIKLQKAYPDMIYNVASTTPHDAEKETEEIFSYFEKKALGKELVAVGESGFDDYIEPDNQKEQRNLCRRYIDLSMRADIPIVFHIRGDNSFENVFKLAKEFPRFPAIIHCFTGNKEQAEKALSLGWYLSISGIVTFKRSTELREVVRNIPLEKMLIETDSPWLAPNGYRGKDNEPRYVVEIAKTIAMEKDLSLEEVCLRTNENAKKVFKIN
jgi:TatD DNase family protein